MRVELLEEVLDLGHSDHSRGPSQLVGGHQDLDADLGEVLAYGLYDQEVRVVSHDEGQAVDRHLACEVVGRVGDQVYCQLGAGARLEGHEDLGEEVAEVRDTVRPDQKVAVRVGAARIQCWDRRGGKTRHLGGHLMVALGVWNHDLGFNTPVGGAITTH